MDIKIMDHKISPKFRINLKQIIIFMIYGFLVLPGFSQGPKINVEDIPQRKVRNYIVSRSIDKMDDFSSIHASWKRNFHESDFNIIEKTFFLNYSPSDSWEFYRHANTLKMWNGKTVKFGLLLSKCTNSAISTFNSSFHEIDTGDVYFLNLKLFKGLLNVEVAFEITRIDSKQRIMEFSYIDNNKSLGKQCIQFFDDGWGNTKIVHRSYFKSDSNIRDKLFYPYFHKKFINEFHRNMGKLIQNRNLPFTIIN
jgi:hypothetical protein